VDAGDACGVLRRGCVPHRDCRRGHYDHGAGDGVGIHRHLCDLGQEAVGVFPSNKVARGVLVVVCIAAMYLLWRYGVHGVGTLVLGLSAAVLVRTIYKSDPGKNPLGSDRDYSIKPALIAALKSLGCFVGSMIWALFMTVEVRSGRLPDNDWVGYGLTLTPVLLLLGLMAFYIWKVFWLIQYGRKKK
jgi:hypothetical protein